jgi:uncharacterized protein YciI
MSIPTPDNDTWGRIIRCGKPGLANVALHFHGHGMKTPLFLLALAFLAVSARAEDKPAPKLPPDMTVYYFCLLTRGPNAGKGTKEELSAGQAAHMANIQRLADSGKLLVAGPFMDRGDWRGIFIFKCASLEEARELVASDPLIKDQRLIADIRPWLTMKGNIRDPEFPAPPFPAKS